MKKIIAVETYVLADVSRDYSKYGENIYFIYKTGMNRIERELENIRRNYRDYKSVTNKIYELERNLKEIESIIKNVNARASEIGKDLYNAAGSYDACSKKEIKIIEEMKIRFPEVDKTLLSMNSDDSSSLPDNILNELTHYVNLASGIINRTDKTISDLSYDLAEIMKQFVKNPDDCLEIFRSVLVNINSSVQNEWDFYYNNYSNAIRSLQNSLSDFGFDVNLESLTDIKLNDFINRIIERKNEQEDEGFSLIDFDRPGELWNEFIKEPYVIFNPVLMTDFTTEFFFTDIVGADVETYSFWRHRVLDVGGLIPGYGSIFDIANGLTYIREGQWVDALVSLGLAIPAFGDFAGVIKLSNLAEKTLNISGFIYDIVDSSGITIDMNTNPNNPNTISNINNEMLDFINDTISELENISSPSDFFELPQVINVNINETINSEWNEYISSSKNLQNSITDFVF